MKSKGLVLVLLFLVAGLCLAWFPRSGPSGGASAVQAQPPQARQSNAATNTPTNPTQVPDRVAYSLLLSLVAHHQTPEQDSHVRSYLRQIGLSDSDIAGFIKVADEFAETIKPLETEAKQIKINNPGPPNTAMKLHLQQLRGRKDAVIDHLVAQLPLKVSRTGIYLLSQHVTEHVKPRVKIQSTD